MTFFIKFCLVNHSINNLLKVPYSIYGSLLLFVFIEKLVGCLIKEKSPVKKYQSSWQLAILNYLPISKQNENITGYKQNKMTQQGYQSHEWQSHILNYVRSFVFKFEILSKVPSVVTCHKFNTKKVQSYK